MTKNKAELEVMSEAGFTASSLPHRRTLLLWLIGTFVVMIVAFEIKAWAYSMRGWEAEVAYTVFYVIFVLSGFGVLAFGALLYGWYKEIELAERDREQYDGTYLRTVYHHVFGPIPWK